MLCYLNAEPHDVRASLRIDDPAGTVYGSTGAQHVEFELPESEQGHGATLTVEADGYQPFEGRVLLTAPQLTWPDGAPCDVTLSPNQPAVSLPRLVTRGPFFALETGEPWTAIEASDFNLYGRFLAGEDIAPALEQRSSIGFNLLRVWLLYDVDKIGRLIPSEHPAFYDRLPEFLGLLAEYGLYAELTVFTGTQRLLPAVADQQFHLDRVADAVRRFNA